MKERKYLIAVFDVSTLTLAQIDNLNLEVRVQAESTDPYDDNDGHPDVAVESWVEAFTNPDVPPIGKIAESGIAFNTVRKST